MYMTAVKRYGGNWLEGMVVGQLNHNVSEFHWFVIITVRKSCVECRQTQDASLKAKFLLKESNLFESL